jgi:D-cysteine desulfhydrase
MSDSFAAAFPGIGERLPKLPIASLPTPVSVQSLSFGQVWIDVAVKHDDLTSQLYGGNKVRKLEYLLRRAMDRGARRIATFGAAGSNHALATAIHASEAGLDCTCFLSHQKATPNVGRTLNMHRQLGTEIVRWGGGIDQVALFREHLQGRGVWVVPLGGTCWLGAVGFVAAAFELALQIEAGLLPHPERIYIACGTTGSAAGLAVGLAAAGVDTNVQAIQVADNPFASEWKMHRLMAKTQFILNRLDPTFIANDWGERITWRDEFLAGGYARLDEATARAVDIAKDQLGLSLEPTYTGKAFAALLHDLQRPDYDGAPYLFWNTYNSAQLPVGTGRPATLGNIPEDFEHYFS